MRERWQKNLRQLWQLCHWSTLASQSWLAGETFAQGGWFPILRTFVEAKFQFVIQSNDALRLLVAGSTAEQRLLLLRARLALSVIALFPASMRLKRHHRRGELEGGQKALAEVVFTHDGDDDFDANSGGEEKDQRNGHVEQLLYHWKDRGKGIGGLP